MGYQIVTDYTSMVVLSDTALADRGIERHNQIRIAREQQARVQRSQQPAKNYRVDRKKPAFKLPVPNLDGGGGAIDPLTGALGILISTAGAVRLALRRRKR